MGCGPLEFVPEVPVDPVFGDRRERSEQVAERTTWRESARHPDQRISTGLAQRRELPPGGDADDPAPDLLRPRDGAQGLLGVSGVAHRDEDVVLRGARGTRVPAHDLHPELAPVGGPRHEEVPRDRGAAHPHDVHPPRVPEVDPHGLRAPVSLEELLGEGRDDVDHPGAVHPIDCRGLQHRPMEAPSLHKGCRGPPANSNDGSLNLFSCIYYKVNKDPYSSTRT